MRIFMVWLGVLCCASWGFSQAPSALRTWSDATGAFKLEAQLVKVDGDSVTLKRKDGKEITMPLTKLSKADREFLQQQSAGNSSSKSFDIVNKPSARKPGSITLLNELGASAGQLPANEKSPPLVGVPALEALEPDPAASLLKYGKAFAATICEVDAYDKLSKPICLDASQGVLGISIGRHVAGQKESRGRIYRVIYGQRKAELLIDAPETIDLLAHDEASGRSLLVAGRDELYRGGDLVLVEGLVEGTPRVLYRGSLPGIEKPGFKPNVDWASLQGDVALVRIDQQLYAWNLMKSELVYQLALEIGAKTTLSPGGKYLAAGGNSRVLIIDAKSGEPLGQIATGTTLIPNLVFDPTGQKLAIGADSRLMIHDLKSGEITNSMTLVSTLGEVLGWVQPGLILTSLAGLIDVELEMGMWGYYLPQPDRGAAIESGLLLTHEQQNYLILQALPVPHAPANKLRTRLASGAAKDMIIQPGTSVSIRVDSREAVDKEAIKSAIEEAATKAGWSVKPKAPIELVAVIGRAPKQTISYNFGFGANAKQESATITPFTSELQIQRGGKVLWTRQTANHVPSILILTEGQTVQQEVSKFEKPDAHFFSSLNLPPRILNPDVTKSKGTSRMADGGWVE